MAEILLASGHQREAQLRRGSFGGGLQGGSPPCTIFFLIQGKIGTFSEPFFLDMCVFPGLELNRKQQFSDHL